MARTIEHDGKTYDLKVTRAGARAAEAAGLSASEIGEKPFSSVGLLFYAALYSQYRVSPAKAVSMLDDLLDSGEVKLDEILEELSNDYAALFGLGESETPKK